MYIHSHVCIHMYMLYLYTGAQGQHSRVCTHVSTSSYDMHVIVYRNSRATFACLHASDPSPHGSRSRAKSQWRHAPQTPSSLSARAARCPCSLSTASSDRTRRRRRCSRRRAPSWFLFWTATTCVSLPTARLEAARRLFYSFLSFFLIDAFLIFFIRLQHVHLT
jgi:hypothetical protein